MRPERSRTAALWVMTIIAALLATACGSTPTTQQPTPSKAPAAAPAAPAPAAGQPAPAAPQPKAGGKVVLATGIEPQNMYHHLALSAAEQYLMRVLGEGLTSTNPDGSVSPALAESWTQPDLQTYVFKLRQGVKFQDGTPFNSSAVVFNFDRLFDKNTKSGRATTNLGMMDKWRAVDENTVEIKLKQPYAPFLAHLGAYPVALMGSPTAMRGMSINDYASKPVGTGPFVLKEWEQGRHLIFTAFNDYWGGRPYLDTFEVRIVRDAATRTVLMRTGEVDFIMDPTPVDFASLQTMPNIKTDIIREPRTTMLELSNMTKPFDQVPVRQAVCYALDRKAIAQNVTRGLGNVTPGVYPSVSWAHDPNAPDLDYNPTKAKELLAQAGLASGFSTILWHPTGRFAGDVQVAQAIQGYLKQVGINAQLKTGDQTAWARAIRGEDPTKPQEAPMYLRLWSLGSGDPQSHAGIAYHGKNFGLAGNYARYKNPQVDALFDQAERLTNQDERQKLYRQADRIITSEAPQCKLYDAYRLVAHKSSLKGIIYGLSDQNYFHKAWFDQ